MMYQSTTARLQPVEILDKICQFCNVEKQKVIGKRRDAHFSECRHLICYVLNSDNYLRLKLTQIGALLGKRHHTTIIHSIKFISAGIETDLNYRQRVIDCFVYVYGTDEYFNHIPMIVEKQSRIKAIADAIVL